MQPKQILITIIFTICFLLLFTCVKIPPTNPFDKEYIGDYQYSIEWNSITNTEKKYIFQTYSILFEDIGDDTFESFKISHPDSGTVDYTIEKNMLNLYFKKEYKGEIIFTGIRRNKIEVHDTCETLKITHPFEIKGEKLLGLEESIPVKMQCVDTGFSRNIHNSIRAIWTLYDTISDTTEWNKSPSHLIDNTGTFKLYGGILDSNNYSYWIDSISLYVPGYRPEIKMVHTNKYNPYLGDSLQFLIKMNHDNLNEHTDNIKITIKGKNNKNLESCTLTLKDLSSPIYHQINDTGLVNFTVHTVLNGLSDSMVVPAKVKYVLPKPKFSDSILEIPLGDTVQFFAVDKNRRPGTKYIWTIKNNGHIATTQSTEFRYFFKKDTVDTIEIFGSFFGLTGKPDRMILDIRKMKYMIRIDTFPREVEVVGDSVEWKVFAVDSTGSQLPENVEYIWKISDSISYHTDSNACKIFIDEYTDSFYVSVYAKINKAEEIKTLSIGQMVYVKKFKPELNFFKKEYLNIVNNTVKCSVIVDDVPPGNIEQIYWKLGNTAVIDSTAANERVWSGKFQNTGHFFLYAWAKDNDGLISDTQRVIINITPDRPFINNLTCDSIIYYKKPTVLYLETEKLPDGGEVVEWFWDFDDDTSKWDIITQTNLCSLTFSEISDTGEKILRAKCRDKSGKFSPLFEKGFRINPGFPEISQISIDKQVMYIRDKSTYRVTDISDKNGEVKKLFFIVDNYYIDSIFKPSDTAEFHYTFSNIKNAGYHEVKIEAEDDMGLRSIVKKSVNVLLGEPTIDNISIITGEGNSDIFFNDTITIMVSANDPNDTITQVYISYDRSQFSVIPLEYDKSKSIDLSFKHIFRINDTGIKTLKIRAKDSHGNLSEIKDTTIRVNLGEPKLNGITTNDSIWIVDTTTIYIQASDTNGFIDSAWVVLGIDTSVGFGESLQVKLADNRIFFNAQFSKSETGFQYLWVKVRDDDNLFVAKKCSVYVRLGQPAAGRSSHTYPDSIQWIAGQNDDLDTLFYVYRNGDSYLIVDISDANGQVDSVLWDRGADGFIDYHLTTPILNAYFTPEVCSKMAVTAVDDDRVHSEPFTFWVYPDSVPPSPSLIADINATKDTIKIRWLKHDLKDKCLTQFKILSVRTDSFETPVLNENTDILVDFAKGCNTFNYDIHTESYLHLLTNFDAGERYFHFQVISKDARGSIAKSNFDNVDSQ